MVAKTNPQLQERAGRNIAALFGLVQAHALEEFRLPSGDLVVMETEDGLDTPGFSLGVGGAADFLTLENKTGVAQTFSLYFRDPEGNETSVAVDNTGAVADDAFGTIPNNLSTLYPLPPGCKYVLRAVGASPATAQDGVRTLRSIARLVNNGQARWLYAARVVGSSFEVENPIGTTGLGLVILLANLSGTALTYTLTLYAADGTVLSVSAPAALAAGTEIQASQTSFARGMRLVVDIQGAPAGGYVFGAVLDSATNDYPAQPSLP